MELFLLSDFRKNSMEGTYTMLMLFQGAFSLDIGRRFLSKPIRRGAKNREQRLRLHLGFFMCCTSVGGVTGMSISSLRKLNLMLI